MTTSVGPIPASRLLHVEWGKATDTRAARWLIAITAFATVAVMLAPLIATKSIDQTSRTYLQFAAFALVTLLPVVSILTLTTEWTQRTVLTTFTQEPRRHRVIGAKVVASVLVSLVATVFGLLVTAGALGIADALGRTIVSDLGVGEILGYALFLLLNMLMGVAFGALLHNSAAAIVLIFALPTAFTILGAAVSSLGEWLDPSRTFDWVLRADWPGHTPQILVCTFVWVLAPLVAGLVRTARREIK